MKDDNPIISGFDTAAVGNDATFTVDFHVAVKLDRNGSTCDAYECTIQRRRAFVKRLKPQYRDNPLYRAAFNKEFDLGVSVSHPSLPRYVAFGGDYIVMDFIEGESLADMLKRGDKRLKDRRFVCKLLSELLGVVEYLHNRNIVHCDIKADNIIISPYSDRPATLIDLDKAYTAWLGDTSGNPAKYGCDTCADGAIDFRGIGMIAGKLGQKRVASACRKDDATAESIKASLHNSHKVVWWSLIAIVAVACAAMVLSSPQKEHAVVQPSTVAPDSATADIPTVEIQPFDHRKHAIDNTWISALIAEKSNDIKGYRQHLWSILDCDTITLRKKRDAIGEYIYSYGMATAGIISSAVRRYSDISELEVQKAVRTDPGWISLEKEEAEMQTRLLEWDAKVSRRSSDHPALLPDTIQGDTLHAPRR